MQIHKEVDVCGLNCPLPILRVKMALSDMKSGQVLKVLTTDFNSYQDFIIFSKQTGNKITKSEMNGKIFVFLIRRR
ncbi:MAG: sulfurtransferase TusA family protein [Burkholderia sp.]|nr:sulfurtransferase TusA family protein [Burkholderia sp.]